MIRRNTGKILFFKGNGQVVGIVGAILTMILFMPGMAWADTVTSTIPVISAPYSEVLNPDESKLYVGSSLTPDAGSVSIVDTATNTELTRFPTGSNRIMDMAMSADGSRLYTGHFTGNIQVMSTATNTVLLSRDTGNSVYGLALSVDGSRIYASDFSANLIRVLSTTDLSQITTIPGGTHPRLIVMTSDGSRAYVAVQGSGTTSQGNVKVIDTASNTVLATIPTGLGTAAVALSPDGQSVYATNFGSNDVSVIDTATNTVTSTIPGGTQPYQVAFTPDGTRAYVANGIGNTVSVIDTTTRTVVSTIPVGTTPAAVRISTDNQTAYIGNQGSNTVSVIALDTFPAITTTSLGDGMAGSDYSATIVAVGRPAPTMTVTDGTFPPGLTLNPDGSITGTPTQAGTFTFTVMASNSVSGIPSSAEQSFTITIAPAQVTSVSTLAATGNDAFAGLHFGVLFILAGAICFFAQRAILNNK